MPRYQIYGCGFNAHGQLKLEPPETPNEDVQTHDLQVSNFAPLSRPSPVCPRLVFTGWSRTASKPSLPSAVLHPTNVRMQ